MSLLKYGFSISSTPPTVGSKRAPDTAVAASLPVKRSVAATARLKPELFAKLRTVPVEDADYQDTSLEFASLRDGRELLICSHVWELPASATAAQPAKSGSLTTRRGDLSSVGDNWVVVPGADALAAVPKNNKTSIALYLLPAVEGPILTLELPGLNADKATYGGADAIKLSAGLAPDGVSAIVLAVTARSLFVLRVAAAKPLADSFAPTKRLTLKLENTLSLTEGVLGAALALSPVKNSSRSYSERRCVSRCALYVDPQRRENALLAHKGSVLVVDLATGTVSRILHLHEPMRLADKEAFICDMALYRPSEGGCKLLSVGSDGRLVRATLDDGKLAWTETNADDGWYATTRGSGGSAKYAYAVPTQLAVIDGADVAITGCQRERVGHVWDLKTTKSSPAGKQVCVTPRFASGNPNKVRVCFLSARLVRQSTTTPCPTTAPLMTRR